MHIRMRVLRFADLAAVSSHAFIQECEILARAMKEWERRPKERAGFSDLPADCMSFKFLRDVSPCVYLL